MATEGISDSILLLLSTDWFCDAAKKSEFFYPILKDVSSLTLVRQAARQIVSSWFVNTSNYYEISFEESRIRKSYADFKEVLSRNLPVEIFRLLANELDAIVCLKKRDFNIFWATRAAFIQLGQNDSSSMAEYPLDNQIAEEVKKQLIIYRGIDAEYNEKHLHTKWDDDLSSKFDGNDSVVSDFFFVQLLPYAFFRKLSVLISSNYDDERRALAWLWISEKIGLLSGLSVSEDILYKLASRY